MRTTPNRIPLSQLGPFLLSLQSGQTRSYRPISSFMSGRRRSFGDSDYFPTGWDREHLLAASMADLRGLPADEFDKMRAGMIAKMGVEAFQHWVSLLPSSASSAATAFQQAKSGLLMVKEIPPQSPAVPDFVRLIKKQYSTGMWGFVMFRSAGYDMSQEAWQEKCQRFETAIRAPLEHCCDADGVKGVGKCFRLEWIQDEALEGDVELVAR